MTQNNGDYPVGYGRPPKNHQFKKGKSGNPSGRPKKMKTEKDILMRVLGKERTIQTPDGPLTVAGHELITMRLLKDALDGKARQMQILYSRMDANGIGREDETDTLTQDDARIVDQYLDLMAGKKGGS